MNNFKEMSKLVSSGFVKMDKESLILVVGGASSQLSATGSCGSTGSSSGCDATAVCNCCQPQPVKKPLSITEGNALAM